MSSKTLVWLSVVVLIISGAAYLSVRSGRAVTTAAGLGSLAPGLPARVDDISAITISRGGTSARLVRTGPADWVLPDKGNFPVEKEKPRALLRALAQATILELKTAEPSLYERLGVADPSPTSTSMLVRIDDKDNVPIFAVIVGSAKPDAAYEAGQPRAGRYVRLASQSQSMLALLSIEAEADPIAWVNRTVADLPAENMRSLEVTQPASAGGGKIRIWREHPEDQAYLAAPIPEGRQLKDEGLPRRCAASLSFAAMEDVQPASAIEGAMGEAVESEFRRFDGVVVRVRTVAADGKRWSTFAASYEPEQTAEPETPLEAGAVAEIKPADALIPEPKVDEDPVVVQARAEVKRLNARWAGWAYALPEFKHDQIAPTLEALLAPATAPGAAGPALPQ